MSTKTAAAPTSKAATPAITAAPAVLLQRTCDCGQHALGREECDGCKKKKLTLHRRTMNSFSPRSMPPIVHEVLRSPGQPLDTATRSFMEPRFGDGISEAALGVELPSPDPDAETGTLVQRDTVDSANSSESTQPEQRAGMGQKKEAPTLAKGTQKTVSPGTPTHCCCCIEDLAIKNIKKIHKGYQYGHQYDLIIKMAQRAVARKASTDCTLKWLEMTNRSYFPKMKNNAWNDMFVLIPSSPTFAPWNTRKNACPGTETITITDRPQADLRKPLRTLRFQITIGSSTGCGCAESGGKTVKAMQKLEPDEKQEIKTQDFTLNS